MSSSCIQAQLYSSNHILRDTSSNCRDKVPTPGPGEFITSSNHWARGPGYRVDDNCRDKVPTPEPGEFITSSNHWARGPGIRVDDNWTPPQPNSCRSCVNRRAVVAIDPTRLTMNFDRRYALCIQTLYHNRTSQSTGAGIRAFIFNLCNDAIVRTRGIPVSACVMRRHYSITYTQSSGKGSMLASLMLEHPCRVRYCTKARMPYV